jgi:hypothetical protein
LLRSCFVYTNVFPTRLKAQPHYALFKLFSFIQLIRWRLFPLLLIVLAHLGLLQLINHVQFTQPNSPDIVPVSIVPDKPPVVSQFTPPPPVKTTVSKKRTAAIKNRANKLTESPTPSPSAATDAEPAAATQAKPPPEALRIAPPPSAHYLLDVVRTEPKLANPYYGVGQIRWQHDGQHYTMQIEAGINMLLTTVRLYHLQSEGSITETGIKPHSVIETRRGKTTTHTQFHYDTHTITFSASDAAIPLTPGAQDRATVFMQLASVGHANPTQFEAGKEITIQVAEDKEAHLHQFLVLNQETINTPLGHLNTWHIVRPPRPGVYSSRIDIWLAPELNWLPVQIRNTESNGAVTMQTIRQIITGTDNETLR